MSDIQDIQIEQINEQDISINDLSDTMENLFIEYFENRGLDITNIETAAKMKQNFYNAAFKYIYKHLFSIPDGKYYIKPKYSYDDIEILWSIKDIYLELCMTYHVDPTLYGYSLLTGIEYTTLRYWGMGEYIQGRNNPQKYKQLSNDIINASAQFTRSDLEDSTLGQITKANHDEEKGLLYARKSAIAAIGAVKIDSLAELTGRYIEHHNVSVDQE